MTLSTHEGDYPHREVEPAAMTVLRGGEDFQRSNDSFGFENPEERDRFIAAVTSDMIASVANLHRNSNLQEEDFQAVGNIVTATLRAYRADITFENIQMAIREGWQRGKK